MQLGNQRRQQEVDAALNDSVKAENLSADDKEGREIET